MSIIFCYVVVIVAVAVVKSVSNLNNNNELRGKQNAAVLTT